MILKFLLCISWATLVRLFLVSSCSSLHFSFSFVLLGFPLSPFCFSLFLVGLSFWSSLTNFRFPKKVKWTNTKKILYLCSFRHANFDIFAAFFPIFTEHAQQLLKNYLQRLTFLQLLVWISLWNIWLWFWCLNQIEWIIQMKVSFQMKGSWLKLKSDNVWIDWYE